MKLKGANDPAKDCDEIIKIPKMLDEGGKTLGPEKPIHNRSFLHGNSMGRVKDSKLEGLALKRTTLPLQLVPTVINLIDDLPATPHYRHPTEQSQYLKVATEEPKNVELTVEGESKERDRETGGKEEGVPTSEAANSVDDLANKEDVDTQLSWEKSRSVNNNQEIYHKQVEERYLPASPVVTEKFKVNPKWGFTSVLHQYDPRRKKCQKKIHKRSKGIKIKKKDNFNTICDISQPTNFFHVAGSTRWPWIDNAKCKFDSDAVITHEEKFARLPLVGGKEKDSVRSSSVETLVHESLEELNTIAQSKEIRDSSYVPMNKSKNNRLEIENKIPMQPRANQSFLWSNMSKYSIVEKKEIVKETLNDLENYDVVGVPLEHNDEYIYDDVALPTSMRKSSSLTTDYTEDDFEIYDDVMPPSKLDQPIKIQQVDETCLPFGKSKKVANINSSSEDVDSSFEMINPGEESVYMRNSYSSIFGGDENEEDRLYDDVSVNDSNNCQSRVNSIYAGSNFISQSESIYAKDSEWEDLDEDNSQTRLRNSLDDQNTPTKKKNRRSKKIRRQRSQASRRNSSRSACRVARRSAVSLAVSLGTGSVLLVGSSEGGAVADETWRGYSATQTTDIASTKIPDVIEKSTSPTQGLVQLRTVDRDEASMDTQETSCYVLEGLVENDYTSSDDSNYETVDAEIYEQANRVIQAGEKFGSPEKMIKSQKVVEAPLRPVPPPPPTESSLTETLGRRMKMLRRTWTITKGSLGRMRRRTSTSTENELNVDEPQSIENSSDLRKTGQVFSLKKHFQKGVSSMSTFYLGAEYETQIDNGKDNNSSADEIYNSNVWLNRSGSWRHNSLRKTQECNSVDNYNMLAEEPLYQFYTTDAVRGAFQSDSDGYDDEESSILLPSASDLAKPGHRTLWCQTPQVIHSGLLDRLTVDEKKLQEAKFEILTSEASYLKSLRVLVNEFLINHELVYESLSATDREKLFGRIPNMLIASERLLRELESTWQLDPMLNGLPGVILQQAEKYSKNYIDYCSNQVSIDSTLKELKAKKNSKFVETVTKIETHSACQSLTLHSFLMLPMQRITRLPLLADAVLSKLSTDHEERLDWEKVLSVLSRIVTDCNEGARNAGRLVEMEMLARKLEYSVKVPPIDPGDRYLVRSGSVTRMLAKPGTEYVLTFRKKYHKTALYLFLLTDYLLITKLKSNSIQDETYSVIDMCKRSLVALEKVPEDSPFAGRHAMLLTLLENYSGRHIEYILSCSNDTERERWLDAVSPPKPNLAGETLYETWDCPQVMALYSYAPSQPDELTLQPGDVIKVLRKMVDGWNLGEKLVGGEQGWFPGNYAKEVASEHVRARNLRQRHRLLALSEAFLQQHIKQPASNR